MGGNIGQDLDRYSHCSHLPDYDPQRYAVEEDEFFRSVENGTYYDPPADVLDGMDARPGDVRGRQ